MEKKLPKGWIDGILLDVSEVSSGIGFPHEFQGLTEGKYPFYKVGDISQAVKAGESLLTVANNYIDEDERFILKGKLFPEGAIVFAKIGEALKLNRRAILTRPSLCDNNVMVVMPKGNCNNSFIYYYLRTQDLSIYSAGNSVPSIRKSSVENLKIPIPPLPEQDRIVAKLNSLFAHLETAKQGLEKIPVLLKQFRQAVLTQAVTGKLTEEWRGSSECKGWTNDTIEGLVNSLRTDIRTGPFGSALKKSEHKLEGIPVWGIESIGKNGEFTGVNKIFVTKEKARELKSFEVKGNDLIISRSGTVGEICILPDDVVYGLISTNLLKIVLKKDSILPLYFCWTFAGDPEIKSKMIELCKGSTRLFITQGILKKLEFKLPPIKEQTEIVRRVEAMFSKADAIEAQYKKLKEQIGQLPQAILAKAFRGEI